MNVTQLAPARAVLAGGYVRFCWVEARILILYEPPAREGILPHPAVRHYGTWIAWN